MRSIKINNISKSYGKGEAAVQALRNMSFEIQEGALFGLIGPDGAGKTSLLRILTTLLLPDEGNATMLGFDTVKDYKSIRKITGYMPGRFSLYQDLSVEENLNFFATIFHTSIKENYHLIKDIYEQIEPFKYRKAGELSGGMKQKLALCCALIHKPSILILDEPTTGVDAVSRKEFWKMLKKLKIEGLTILVATPYMDEAMLCDSIALMQEGSILDIDSPEKLIEKNHHELWAVRAQDMYRLLQDLRQYIDVAKVYPFGTFYHVTPKNTLNDGNVLLKWLHEKGHRHTEMKQIAPNIEDIFIDLMQKQHHAQ